MWRCVRTNIPLSFIIVMSSSVSSLATLPVASRQPVRGDGSPFDVKPLRRGGAQFIQRTAHCMFDLGNLRILSCINPRVLSFRGGEPQFLRGIFFPKRVIMPLKLTSRSCVISFAKLSAYVVNTAEIHGRTSSCPSQWPGFPTLQWCRSTIFSIFLVVGTVPRQSSSCSARSLLSVLMISSSSSPLFPTSSISFQPTATPS